MHPALEGATVEFGLCFDLAIRDRRAAEDPADRALLVRLTKYQQAIEPDRCAHAFVMSRLEQHAPQPGVVVFPSHLSE
jgi:hypothetical protein